MKRLMNDGKLGRRRKRKGNENENEEVEQEVRSFRAWGLVLVVVVVVQGWSCSDLGSDRPATSLYTVCRLAEPG